LMYFKISDSIGVGAAMGFGVESCIVVCVGLIGSGRVMAGEGAGGADTGCAGAW
jgi:hypothetical protein